MLLQFGPGGVLFGGVAFVVLQLVVTVGIAYGVHVDARRRGLDDADLWTLGVAVGGAAGGLYGVAAVAGVYLVVHGALADSADRHVTGR